MKYYINLTSNEFNGETNRKDKKEYHLLFTTDRYGYSHYRLYSNITGTPYNSFNEALKAFLNFELTRFETGGKSVIVNEHNEVLLESSFDNYEPSDIYHFLFSFQKLNKKHLDMILEKSNNIRLFRKLMYVTDYMTKEKVIEILYEKYKR